MEPQRECKHVTKLVPLLKPRENCLDIPKEVCGRSRTNPRKVQKPIVKKWCYTSLGDRYYYFCIVYFFTLRTVFVPMRSFFVSRCSFQFMKLLFPPFFIFQNRCITRIFFFQDFWKKKLFFQDFWNQLFTQAGFILKTFSKGKKIIFCMEFLKIICLGEFCFLSNVVPKAQAFLSPQTFSFASMTSLVFNIVLPGS